jgi:hypothetical protein
MLITSEHIRAARALLRREQSDLARASGVPLSSLKRLERRPGPLSAHARTVEALRAALEAVGVEFTNGDATGVKLMKRMKEPAQ